MLDSKTYTGYVLASLDVLTKMKHGYGKIDNHKTLSFAQN